MTLYINRNLVKEGYPSEYKISLPSSFENYKTYRIELFKCQIPDLRDFYSSRGIFIASGEWDTFIPIQPGQLVVFDRKKNSGCYWNLVNEESNKIKRKKLKSDNLTFTVNTTHNKNQIPEEYLPFYSYYSSIIFPSVFNIVEQNSYMYAYTSYDTINSMQSIDNVLSTNNVELCLKETTKNLIATSHITPDGMVNLTSDYIPYSGNTLIFEFYDQSFNKIRISELLIVLKFNY